MYGKRVSSNLSAKRAEGIQSQTGAAGLEVSTTQILGSVVGASDGVITDHFMPKGALYGPTRTAMTVLYHIFLKALCRLA